MILLAIVALVHPQFYFQTNVRDIQVGPVTARMATEKNVTVPPIVSALVLLVGAWLAYTGMKKP